MDSSYKPKKTGAIIQRITSRFQEFARIGSLGGILLLLTVVVSMIWANSQWASYYFDLWNIPLEIRLSDFQLDKPLLIWVNDALMAIFFFYVGLEIKREIKVGELSQPGQAVLPVIAAIGGILVPAGMYLLLTQGGPGSEGWGVPMATDIAFSLGLLLLLGERVPDSLKIFLIAFAIADDLAAVLVIAVFYSTDIYWMKIAAAGGFYLLMWLLNFLNVRNSLFYLAMGIAMWYFFLKGGIHPTVAGILAAFAIPANSLLQTTNFVEKTKSALNKFLDKNDDKMDFLTKEQVNAIDDMGENIEKVQPTLQRLENMLHEHVNYLIMPVFALANAGVSLQMDEGSQPFGPLTWYVAICLLFGKAIGITSFCWVAVKLKLAGLPSRANWANMAGIGLLGGVGFTMALFIAGLAFNDLELLNQTKIGILVGSLLAGISGMIVLRLSLKQIDPPAGNT